MAYILAVEKDEQVRLLYERIFDKKHDVRSVADGETALNIIKSECPDLVLTGFQLSGMNGLELIAAAKKLHPKLPCIMISGTLGENYQENAFKSGADEFMEKPFRPAELSELVNRYLQ